MNFSTDNYNYHKEAEDIRKKQNKVFSKDNKTYIPEKYINKLLRYEKLLYEEIQKTYSDLETRKSKFRNSILKILEELEKEQIEQGLNPLFIEIGDYAGRLDFYTIYIVDPASSVFYDIV